MQYEKKRRGVYLVHKKAIFIVIGILVGLVVSMGGVYVAVTITGSNVTYSNSSSGLTSTTVLW